MNHGNVLIKVYGHVWPVKAPLLHALTPLLSCLSQETSADPVLELDGDLLRISFEGIYFPLDEVVAVLGTYLDPDSQGKLDYLDMDAWTLTRHRIAAGTLEVSSASLNAVLDYSGH